MHRAINTETQCCVTIMNHLQNDHKKGPKEHVSSGNSFLWALALLGAWPYDI